MKVYKKKRFNLKIILLSVVILTLLTSFIIAERMVNPEREYRQAREDLESAIRSYNNGDYKWATIQAYFSVYHSAQVITNKKWFDEVTNSHKQTAEELKSMADKNKLSEEFYQKFNEAKWARIKANYYGYYYQDVSKETIEIADLFFKKATTYIK